CLGNQLPVDLDPFAKRNQMRRSKQADSQTRHSINGFQHCAGRAFAIGPSDMNESQVLLRVTCERGQLERVGKPELRPEPPQTIKELDGLAVSHFWRSYTVSPTM